MTDQTVDCVAQCAVNLTKEELNQITRDVHQTLIHPKGNELYANYLAVSPDRLKCLEIYNTCSKYLNKEQNQSTKENLSTDSLQSLFTKVERLEETVSNIDVPELDLDLMKKFKNALKEEKTREALLTVLDETKTRCQLSLSGKIHEHFTNHIISRYRSS
ncbi:uncharacterized protein LOC105834495 [Monomorium pharaonis]|uniref:uncharacterized protein LOC105834495 n=1 Tax=Monomorium pharaonis TaxID=307658 RepID=UPI00063F5BCC|nr:uncharacterized protein LOC105834495 [Monomorium pharaonis]